MLPVHQRLRDNRDFRRIYARGRSYVHSLAVLYVLRRVGESAQAASGQRIGFVVSKKQGKAAARNRIKRRLREAVRLRRPALREGPFDLIFVARGRLRTATWPEVRAAVDTLLHNAGMLQPSPEGPGIAGSGSEVTGGEKAGAGGN
ncbi:MAG TPA: ribonuclease P protein component [Chthonomonadaceae bacterium]|nr:ribonuclease P protein component [Chthonomonadaceae bacterium]